MNEDERQAGEAAPFEGEFQERLRSVKSVTERRTIAGLARELGSLPVDAARAALEMSAGVAGVSLRASIEFLRAAPRAARVIEAADLRAWGEMGRRLAMGDVETAVSFFNAGVEELASVPLEARPLVFQVCSRQMTLSSAVALETFRSAPLLAAYVTDPELLRMIFEVAAEISKRSARHSADFLKSTPRVARRARDFGPIDAARIFRAAILLASAFAARGRHRRGRLDRAAPSALRSEARGRASVDAPRGRVS